MQLALNELLRPNDFRDYCPNGLQVEGKEKITKLVTGVTASLSLIEAAIEKGADAILVHHGYFWKGEDPTITSIRKSRIKLLLENDINLFAFHLPLDAHPQMGNNAQLGLKLG
ncbi:MAG: Nif3-like dinuclear metal center hexameric protein, partial [Pseudomonadales bacterium]